MFGPIILITYEEHPSAYRERLAPAEKPRRFGDERDFILLNNLLLPLPPAGSF
jgi:hypothetical protein